MSDWKTVGKQLVNLGLPVLGAAIGGAPGSALGKLLAGALGLDDDSKPADYENVLATLNPEALERLRQFELTHEQELQKLALKQAEIELQDRVSARQREVAVTGTTGQRDWNLYILAWMVVIGFMGAIILLALSDNPFTNNQAGLILLGALATGFGTVLSYFFGSSQGSASKNKMLEKVLNHGR